jgi:glycosyltransferase involved in cell wall biosynthesis
MLSIITVTRNAARTIGDCLASVAAQSVRPEHWIIDGASTDGTLEIVRAWTGHPVQVFSEPDRGIYDAMNKGIERVTGDIIGILNADDTYADPDVLGRVQKALEDASVDACYGDLVYVKEEGRRQKAEVGGQRAEDTEAPKHRSTEAPKHRPARSPVTGVRGKGRRDRFTGAGCRRIRPFLFGAGFMNGLADFGWIWDRRRITSSCFERW